MTFNDIFKSNFLENIASVTIFDMILSILLAFLLGLFIYFVYRKTFSGVAFSHSFGISLIAMTMITTLVILAVTSNVVLSLGMVGALSIVRFRTAIKEPLDVAFLFWAIGAGVHCAGRWNDPPGCLRQRGAGGDAAAFPQPHQPPAALHCRGPLPKRPGRGQCRRLFTGQCGKVPAQVQNHRSGPD